MIIGGTMRKIMLMACAAFALCAAGGGIDTGLLDSLLRVKSVSRDKENLRKAVDVLKAWLEARGVSCVVERNEKGMVALYASTTPGKSHDYVFVSHVDVVPDEASMVLSCRFTTMDDYRLICDCLRRTSGCEVQAPKAPHRLPVANRDDDPEIASLFASLRTAMPGLRLGRMSAATDATYYVHLGLPIVIFTADGCEPHSSNERGSISSMNLYADALTRYLATRE